MTTIPYLPNNPPGHHVSETINALIDRVGSGAGLRTVHLADLPSTHLFTALAPSGVYSWVSLDITAKIAIIWRFTTHASVGNLYGVQCSSQPAGAGRLMLAAEGMPSADYALSWPWVYMNEDGPATNNLHIGIRNDDVLPSNYDITDFEALVIG